MSKIIKAVFVGRFCKTQRVFRYDTDDKIQFVNLDLPANYTVDFANSKTGESKSVLATSDTVQIPPEFFVPGSEIYAWVWLSDANGGHTRCEACIQIDPRAKRTSTEPTPAEASAWDEAVNTLNETIEGIPAVIDAALTEAKESGEFDGKDGNNAWTVDAQYVRVVAGVVQAQTAQLVGPSGATVKIGDIVFVSDGRFADVTATNAMTTRLSVVGDLHGKDGEDGFAPEVSINPIDGGHRVTITSAAHPEGQSFDVMDGQGGGSGSASLWFANSGVLINGGAATVNVSNLDGSGSAPAVGDLVWVMYYGAAYGLDDDVYKINSIETDPETGIPDSLCVLSKVITVATGAYKKPSSGIPKTDLAAAVQTSLGKADTALQTSQGVAHAGEFVVVGSDGNITTVTMTAWEGGSY